MRVLIADDEQMACDLLESILTKGGNYETDFALDGAEAMQKIKSSFYDALLLDIAMPKMDGYEVLKQVRKIFPEMPVIFVTGKGEAKKVAASIAQYKLSACIEKPFTPEVVLSVLSQALKPKKPVI